MDEEQCDIRCTLITANESRNQVWEERGLSPTVQDPPHTVNLFPQFRYQALRGFGVTYTEVAGYPLSRLPEAVQIQVLDKLLWAGRLGNTKRRVLLNSCDFSLGSYAAC